MEMTPQGQIKLAGGVGARESTRAQMGGSIRIIKVQESYINQKASVCNNVEKMEP